jgi:undecaprenyl-diphosphatase
MPPRTAVAATLAATLAIAAIGFNRVYNGVHWPSDVAGGAAIGALLVVAAYRLPEWAHRRLAAGEIGGAPGKAELG